MALSGTLDTFALPDVLRLLASTAKTGRLRITGDRGSGSVWVADGDVVATELASAVSQDPSNAEVVFGLLRFSAGSFTFEADAAAPQASSPSSLEPILGAAENMLVEWRAIEEVIPSLDVWVALRPALEGPDVMIDQSRWRGIATIGSGCQVGAVAETLLLNEIDACRLVKELIELRLVEFIDEPTSASAPSSFEPTPAGPDEIEDLMSKPLPADDPTPSDDPVDSDVGVEMREPEALLDELDAMGDAPSFRDTDAGAHGSHREPSLTSLASLAASDADANGESGSVHDEFVHDARNDDIFADAGAMASGDDELDPAEMARQLANLSPKAAKAVAAAAKATTDAERDAALAAVEAEDDTVNRGLLLKFLGSVDS